MAFRKRRFCVGAQFYWANRRFLRRDAVIAQKICAPTRIERHAIDFRPVDSTGYHLTGSPVFFAAI